MKQKTKKIILSTITGLTILGLTAAVIDGRVKLKEANKFLKTMQAALIEKEKKIREK